MTVFTPPRRICYVAFAYVVAAHMMSSCVAWSVQPTPVTLVVPLSQTPKPSPSVTPKPTSTSLPPTPTATASILANLAGRFVFIGGSHLETEIYMVDVSCVAEPSSCNTNWTQLTNTFKESPLGFGERPDIDDLTASPDGRKIAFSYLWVDEAGNENTDISVLDIEKCLALSQGCTEHDFDRFTTDLADDSSPAWSPDGKTIAFVSNRSPRQGTAPASIYLMNADGSNQRVLIGQDALANPASYLAPSWSPDGQKLAFNVIPLQYRHPDIVIYTANADGSEVTQLTFIAHNEAIPNQRDSDPQWSPDGREILFWTGRATQSATAMDTLGIAVVSANGGEIKVLNERGDWAPYWSPDGTKILYVNRGASGGLYVMKATGGPGVRVISERVDKAVWLP